MTRRKTMSKKTQFTRSNNKIGSLSWTSPIYTHGEGKYQNKILHDNIPGYPGYHISKRGKIYSRWDVNGKGILNKRYHLKQPHLNKNGRYIVGLSQPGIGTTKWLLHRLVALVYIPNPENLPYVCHKDNVPTNNSVMSQGGHLTHGSPVNMSGKNYNFVSYGVSAEDGRIDYAALAKQVAKVRPKLIVAGASAYPRAIDFEKLAEIAHGYGAMLMVDMAHIAGLVAGGQHQSPVPYADVVTTTTHKTLRGPRGGLILTNNEYLIKRINSAIFPGTQGGPLEHVIAAKAVCFGEALKPEFKEYARKIVENAKALEVELTARGVKLVSGGTDNHLLLIDLTDEDCTGKELEPNLDEVHITANKNTVPGEKRSPFVTSGVRIGTPAVTTRGMGVEEMKIIADCIADCIFDFAAKKDDIAKRVADLTAKFPLYE